MQLVRPHRQAEPVWRVSSGPARRAVEELRRHGWTYARIAQTTGLSVSTVFRVTVADRCTNRVADAVLGVAP